jgi:hypothetical protein
MLKVGAARAAWAGRSVRTDRHRYTLWPDGFEELFDLASDPDARTNLAGEARHAQVKRAMRLRLDALPPLKAAPAE